MDEHCTLAAEPPADGLLFRTGRQYSWVDPQGVTHYTDAPSRQERNVDLRVSPLIGTAPTGPGGPSKA